MLSCCREKRNIQDFDLVFLSDESNSINLFHFKGMKGYLRNHIHDFPKYSIAKQDLLRLLLSTHMQQDISFFKINVSLILTKM